MKKEKIKCGLLLLKAVLLLKMTKTIVAQIVNFYLIHFKNTSHTLDLQTAHLVCKSG